MVIKWFVAVPMIVIIAFIALRLAIWIADVQPKSIGEKSKQLTPCPGTPNCVSSTSLQSSEQIEPMRYTGEQTDAHATLLSAIAETPNSTIRTQTPDYVHVEFKTLLLGFIDDAEFLFNPDEKIIHLRSASRIGRSDFGVNRKRLQTLRESFDRLSRQNL